MNGEIMHKEEQIIPNWTLSNRKKQEPRKTKTFKTNTNNPKPETY